MMKRFLVAAAAALVFAFGSVSTASAQSVNVGAAAVSGAGAESNLSTGNYFGAAGVAGAYCTDGVVIGPLGFTTTMRACVAAEIAESAGRLGTMSPAEVRAVQLAALDDIGYGLSTEDHVVASTRNPTMAAVAAPVDPMSNVRSCTLLDDGRPEVRVRSGLSAEDQAAAVAACVDSLS